MTETNSSGTAMCARADAACDAIVRACADLEPGAVYGVAASQLDTGESVFLRADETFPTASVIKISIVATVLAQAAEGRLSLDTLVPVRREDLVGGSGVLSQMTATPNLALALGDLATLAISVSDNTASNLCLAAVGGEDVVNARMRDDWQMTATTIHRPILFHLTAADPPFTATGTPRDFLRFLTLLANGILHEDRAVSDKLRALMETTVDTEMLPRHLSINPFANDLNADTPPFVVAHKPGATTGVRCDVGLIQNGDKTLAVAAFVKGSKDTRWTPENTAARMVAAMGEILTKLFP